MIILWFRQDLRLSDNLALIASIKQTNLNNEDIIPIYIHDPQCLIGRASQWWLDQSLMKLNESMNGQLMQCQGDSRAIISEICKLNKVSHVFCNQCYNPIQDKIDELIKGDLAQLNVEFLRYNSYLLWNPESEKALKQNSMEPYKVFTPFYKHISCLPVRKPESISQDVMIPFKKITNPFPYKGIYPEKWHIKFQIWNVGEKAALNKFEKFLANGLNGYKHGRNYPHKNNVSRLSPHLHFGEISPNYIWHRIKNLTNISSIDSDHFLSELGWREFSYYLLHHFPAMQTENFQDKFDDFEWHYNAKYLKAWERGKTGFPIIDAAMMELWDTGYMHNRSRMIVGSFLTKNLGIHWKYGKAWFDDCLLDADQANNAAGWQWIAGSGADAAPYFRIFNPVLQSEKFDPDAQYIKTYLPNLHHIKPQYLHNPIKYGNMLPEEYPKPIISLEESRNIALNRYKSIKN